jgi:ABC-type transport system substrate-binding protein
MGYCNRKFSNILNQVSTTLEASKRASLLNAAELTHMAKDIPSIPVYARPVFVIRKRTVNGPVVNPTQEGSPWNANTWTTA